MIKTWTYNRRHNPKQIMMSIEIGEDLSDREIRERKQEIKAAFEEQKVDLRQKLNQLNWVYDAGIDGGMSYQDGKLIFSISPKIRGLYKGDNRCALFEDTFRHIMDG